MLMTAQKFNQTVNSTESEESFDETESYVNHIHPRTSQGPHSISVEALNSQKMIKLPI